jgi:hypothetical protein
MGTMSSVLITSTLVKLGFALASLMIIQLFTIYANHRIGRNFKEDIYTIIDDTPMSLAVYHGLRWVGACILIGMVLA